MMYSAYKLNKLLRGFKYCVTNNMGFPGGSVVKNLPAKVGDMDLIPGLGRSPGEGNGNSSILAWDIPWTEESGGLQSMGSQKSWI